jgi:hypothetical protein
VSFAGGGDCNRSPAFDLCFDERRELVDVQTLIAMPTVKRINKRILHEFACPNEVNLQSVDPLARHHLTVSPEYDSSVKRDGGHRRKRWIDEAVRVFSNGLCPPAGRFWYAG